MFEGSSGIPHPDAIKRRFNCVWRNEMLFSIVLSRSILLDHPSCLIEDGRRNRDSELLGCLQVDDQTGFGSLYG